MEPCISRLNRSTLTEQHLGRFRCIQTRLNKGIPHPTQSRSRPANNLEPVGVRRTNGSGQFRSSIEAKQPILILCTQIRDDVGPEQRFSPTFDLISAQVLPAQTHS